MSRKKVEPLIASAVIGAAAEGQTTAQIMELTGLTEKKIQQIAKGAGIKIKRSTSHIPDDVKAKIAEMHKNGYTRREIAMAFGISTRSVSTYIPKDKPEPKAAAENGGADEPPVTPDTSGQLDEGAPTLAEAINRLAEAIDTLARAGKEAVIKVRVNAGDFEIPAGSELTLTKVERTRIEKQGSKEENT